VLGSGGSPSSLRNSLCFFAALEIVLSSSTSLLCVSARSISGSAVEHEGESNPEVPENASEERQIWMFQGELQKW
jgi:hypothetical protein